MNVSLMFDENAGVVILFDMTLPAKRRMLGKSTIRAAKLLYNTGLMRLEYDSGMSRHTENECAFCAGELEPESCYTGVDWKVYCSRECAQAGALIEAEERAASMSQIDERRSD